MSTRSLKSRRRLFLTLLLMITLIGAAARLYRLEEKSLWSDEVATIATSLGNSIDPQAYRLRGEAFDPPQPVPARVYAEKATYSHGAGNFTQTAEVLKANVHPPLFFWLMNLWIHAFGSDPGVLRLPAAIFGILAIPLIGWLALKIFDLNGTAPEAHQAHWQRYGFSLLSAAFMALSAYQVDHAQDARQYTFLVVLALLAVGLAARLVLLSGQGWPAWLGLAMVLAMGLYTQYFFVVFAGFVLLYLGWQGRRNTQFLLKLALTAGLVGLLALPWLDIFQVQMTFFKTVGHYTAGLWNPVRLPEKLWRIVCEFFLPKNTLGKLIPLLVLCAALLIGWARRKKTGEKSLPELRFLSPALVLILLWLGLVIGGQVALDILKNTQTATIRRYLLLASPACYLLLAYSLVWMGAGFNGRRWQPLLTAGLTVLMLGLMAGDTIHVLLGRHTSSDEFRQAAAWINKEYQSGDLVLVSKSGAMATGMALYLKSETRMLGVDVQEYQELADGSPLMQRLDRAVDGRPRVWLVFSHAARSTRFRLDAWLAENHFQPVESRKVPGVRVSLLRR
jgi:uncharacterized membrane protein